MPNPIVRISAWVLFAGGLVAAAASFAADKPPADAPELAKYNRTGKYETCLVNHQIQNIRILNSRQILFEMYGGGAYLAEPQHCPALSPGLALAYDATIDEFCNTTIVRLIDPGTPVMERGSCGIDRFEKLEKKKS